MKLVIENINFITNATLLFFLVGTSIAIIRSRNLLNSTILLSVFSMLMAMEYLMLGAPDVAITEASVGGGISTILLLLGIFMVGNKEKKVKNYKLFAFIITSAVAALLIYTIHDLPVFGSQDSPAAKHIADYYLKHSLHDTEVPNVVTAILASYRGFDTFGEVLVIFTSSIAVLMLLGKSIQKKKRN